ncbi:hypothetical protein CR513_15853, partial [Mucuna pruriens]
MSCFVRESEIERAFFSNQPMLVLVYNEACLNSKIDPSSLPIYVISLLQEVQDVFPTEVPNGLPSIKGIEYHIDLNPGTNQHLEKNACLILSLHIIELFNLFLILLLKRQNLLESCMPKFELTLRKGMDNM